MLINFLGLAENPCGFWEGSENKEALEMRVYLRFLWFYDPAKQSHYNKKGQHMKDRYGSSKLVMQFVLAVIKVVKLWPSFEMGTNDIYNNF